MLVGGLLIFGLIGAAGVALQQAVRRTVRLGAAVSAGPLRDDPAYAATLRNNFSSITTENELKFEIVQPERGVFSFAAADAIVAFAEQHELEVRGHTLVWHNQLPDWLRDGQFSRDDLLRILREHITTVVGRYQGRIAAWDVVNEAFASDGTLRDNLWLRGIGPEYIRLALRWAHEADPEARLYLNEFGLEFGDPKARGVERAVSELLRDEVPLHGIGFQMHLALDNPPDPVLAAQVMQRFADLGLRTDITEMEVAIQNGAGSEAERIAAQAALFGVIARICAEQPACQLFSVWGVADHYSWLPAHTGRPDAPLLFDERYRPKPAHAAVLRALEGRLARGP